MIRADQEAVFPGIDLPDTNACADLHLQAFQFHPKRVKHCGCLIGIGIDISVPVFRVNPKLKKKRDCFPGVEFFNDPPWEEWIFRMITQWFLMCVCEITSPVSCGQDLFPDPVFMLQKDDARAVRRRCHSGHHPCRASSDHCNFSHRSPILHFLCAVF